eukprot:Protomagalhaensia_sp_Gyna_25__381@NODE_1180_length_2093_cov_148_861733_g937_i0_p2_GENE_NODE_1180_length_2093_cov_148_861733_g937_i0NODE_1180_length_2093_cov_148_861733_g937_i0_p2_ORF_typecomplete_len271_score47_29_NODE_1180_length_2093_cov_148_861733_g937_i024815
MPGVATELNQWAEQVLSTVKDSPIISEDKTDEELTASRDPVLDAEVVLLLHAFEALLLHLKVTLDNPEREACPNDMALLRLNELKCAHEKIGALSRKCQPRWDRLLEQLTVNKHAQDGQSVLRPRPEMFFSEDAVDEPTAGDNQVYRPPKRFAMTYGPDDEEAGIGEQRRLQESEMVRAVTADILPIPEIVGDGFEELTHSERKILRKTAAKQDGAAEYHAVANFKKAEIRRVRDLKRKQALSRVGSTLEDLGEFARKIAKRR